ncbi:Uncharacterised protein [Vibrio cholerae]|uniref:Uncharacterized protein n=1 Tax=Vibrio cholerae TaxID=666 RepID=A0A655XT55_VIBCL|nr:Uncharacterised protein [Vibrio cholerae]
MPSNTLVFKLLTMVVYGEVTQQRIYCVITLLHGVNH